MEDVRVIHGDCLEVLPTVKTGSVDCVVTDPPYPEIDRPYGRMTEAGWHEMMRAVVGECRRVLKPSGSAMFVLQPNQERLGRTRPWLFEFIAWAAREWNLIQDAWWWNHAALPNATAIQGGLLRPSVKACVWLGDPNCYRDQESVLWSESQANVALRTSARSGRTERPSGHSVNEIRISESALRRGGVLPFNLLPIANTDSQSSAGSEGHGAGTPESLADWWIRYICPPGGLVLDPFAGVASIGRAAKRLGRRYLGIEQHADYIPIAERRLADPPMPLFEERAREAETPMLAGMGG